jgi:hypothetical protein
MRLHTAFEYSPTGCDDGADGKVDFVVVRHVVGGDFKFSCVRPLIHVSGVLKGITYWRV